MAVDTPLQVGTNPQPLATVPYSSIVAKLNNYFRKTVVTTVITADTQCRMLLPTVITSATILK